MQDLKSLLRPHEGIRIAHISDLHFSKATFRLSQFFSKRWIGNFNLIFSRKKDYDREQLFSLIDLFKQLQIQHLLISGDLTSTSLEEEFKEAAQFIDLFKKEGIEVFTLPGNHDHYTKRAFRKKLFYQFFDTKFSKEAPFNLKEHGITVKELSSHWWLIILDTAVATSLISSKGYFSPSLEKNLEQVLSLIPKNHKILLANHFPFFQNDSPRKVLVRGSNLKEILKRCPHIKLYLHGHTHRHCVADLRGSGLPIVLDSGSTSYRNLGTWNLIDITEGGCKIAPFRYDSTRWQPIEEIYLPW